MALAGAVVRSDYKWGSYQWVFFLLAQGIADFLRS